MHASTRFNPLAISAQPAQKYIIKTATRQKPNLSPQQAPNAKEIEERRC